jgi:CheY-like chemotaxis protein
MRPGLDGLEFLKIMKSDAALCNIPVLMVASRERGPWAEAIKHAGLDPDHDVAGYVTKPFGPLELLEAVEAALSQYGKAIPPQAPPLTP